MDPPEGGETDPILFRAEAAEALLSVAEGRATSTEAMDSLRAWEGGSVGMRIRLAVVAGELLGPPAARRRLLRLPGDAERSVVRLLTKIYAEGASPGEGSGLSDRQGFELWLELGWFAKVALYPGGSRDPDLLLRLGEFPGQGAGPRQAMRIIEWGLLGVGAILLAIALARLRTGRFRARVRPSRGVASGPFAEATALWLALDLGFLFWGARALEGSAGALAWFLVPFGFAGVALAWPVFRGVYGRRTQLAFGWTRGAGVGKEAALGLLAYPALFAAQFLVYTLVDPGEGHPHSSLAWLTSGIPGPFGWALAGALIQAPVLEEAEFRGILYRFLRDATRGLPVRAGIAASILVSSFLFAICHPQGWPAVPEIMTFAAFAAFLREWRGSLIAPMALHLAVWIHILARMWIVGAP